MQQKSLLHNSSIVVTRPIRQSHHICQQLAELGARPIQFPCIEIQPNLDVDSTNLERLVKHSEVVIFISSNAVNYAFTAIPNFREIVSEKHTMVAVGSATAQTLRQHGMQQILTPDDNSDSEGILELKALQHVKQKMILIIKGMGGRELLFDTLQERGADVHNIELYQRILPKDVDVAPLTEKIDLILFTSSEAVNNFLTLVSNSLQESLLACQTMVGHPKIAEKVSSLGFKKLPIIAATPADADMLTAIIEWAGER